MPEVEKSPALLKAEIIADFAKAMAASAAEIDGPDKAKFILAHSKHNLGIAFAKNGKPYACSPHLAARYEKPADCPKEVYNGHNELAKPMRLDAACAANCDVLAGLIQFLNAKDA